MIKHRAFNVDRFVDKFLGRETLLRNFVKLWGDGLNVKVASPDIRAFKKLIRGDGHPGGFVSRAKRWRFKRAL